MGGWMTYRRVRARNHIAWRPDDGRSPYPPRDVVEANLARPSWYTLVGDLNRMEQDYLNPQYPTPPGATREPGSDPAAVCARATGVDVDSVRAVLAFVFRSGDGPTDTTTRGCAP